MIKSGFSDGPHMDATMSSWRATYPPLVAIMTCTFRPESRAEKALTSGS